MPKQNRQKGFIEIAGLGITALGIAALFLLANLNASTAKSRDAKRMTDVKELSRVIDLYIASNKRAPENLLRLVPAYLDTLPEAPLPADGKCTNDDNSYDYEKTGNKTYQISFCLGDTTNGYLSGKHVLTEIGLK